MLLSNGNQASFRLRTKSNLTEKPRKRRASFLSSRRFLNHQMTNAPRSVVVLSAPQALLVLGAAVWISCAPPSQHRTNDVRLSGPVTFNRDVAPIVFQHCVPCHRPGQSAPFGLLDYKSVVKRASQIVELTRNRNMPPWLPEPGYGVFEDARSLSTEQIETFEEWLAAGAVEGNPAHLPALPELAEGWQLGEPDLVVQLEEPYMLSPDGLDVYRNFVIPAPLNKTRFVRALEFKPNSRSVHHVRILLDSTLQSRHMDAQDNEPGFSGMTVPAKFPEGHMITWVPGRFPKREPDGLAWVLENGTDIVLQIHMQRTGKPELIQPAIGLYFTEQPPTKTACRIGLLSQLIDIPAGENNYVVERSFNLPSDVDVLAVLPHLHYLGRQIEGFAILPDGSKEWLLLIKNWDFNWQDEYRFAQPIFLPKGSVISMRYTYDNSSDNPRNPHSPPQRVGFGPQSVDEMGELWLQVLPGRASDLPALQSANRMLSFQETAAYYENQLKADPGDPLSHFGLGKVLGPLGRIEESLNHFQAAIELQPDFVEARYYLGLTLYHAERWEDARTAFETVIRSSPEHFKAHDGLGLTLLQLQRVDEALAHFRIALSLNPEDAVARTQLQRFSISDEGRSR